MDSLQKDVRAQDALAKLYKDVTSIIESHTMKSPSENLFEGSISDSEQINKYWFYLINPWAASAIILSLN